MRLILRRFIAEKSKEKGLKFAFVNDVKGYCFMDLHKNLHDFNNPLNFSKNILVFLLINSYLCRWINCVQL